MKFHIIDGNNVIHRYINSSAYPLKRFLELLHQSVYPIIVWDGYHALAKRREIFPDYKVQRDRSKSSIAYEVMDVARELADNMNCIQVRVTGAEADDVIAHMVNKLTPEKIEFIHSNDIDLAGFGIPTMHTKPVPDHLKLYKTLVGKSSDNVKGLRLFGPKAWEKLSDKDKFTLLLILEYEAGVLTADLINNTQTFDPVGLEAFEDQKLGQRVMDDLENLRVLWKISNFIPITEKELDEGTTQGTLNENNIEMIRREYLLWPTH